ncbi:MAG TPA: glycoside hydrolase family 43 protein [Acidimicrobiia bacterium]|nr:glycoside hydrolase family 43 protein [Acidimicrobiia bacterium]
MSTRPAPRRTWRSRRGLLILGVVVALIASVGIYLVVNAAKSTACDTVRFRTAGPAPTVHGRPPLGSGGLAHLLHQAFHGSSPAVYCNDFPDPFVLRVGDNYYVYSTNTASYHVPVLTTGGLTGGGSRHDALPVLPAWSAGDEVWAPSVLQRGSAFILYYATRPQNSNKLCISAAISASPTGPFVDRSPGPIVCPPSGAIDPSPFVDASGQGYLLFKNDGAAPRITSQPIDASGLHLVGTPATLLTPDQPWEDHVVEAPSMVRDGNRYYLFYSGGKWNTADYAIGYAVCASPSGPCTKALDHPWLGSNFTAQGPGGQEFFTDPSGQQWMVLHAWVHDKVGYPFGARNLFVLRVVFVGGVPEAA